MSLKSKISYSKKTLQYAKSYIYKFLFIYGGVPTIKIRNLNSVGQIYTSCFRQICSLVSDYDITTSESRKLVDVKWRSWRYHLDVSSLSVVNHCNLGGFLLGFPPLPTPPSLSLASPPDRLSCDGHYGALRRLSCMECCTPCLVLHPVLGCGCMWSACDGALYSDDSLIVCSRPGCLAALQTPEE